MCKSMEWPFFACKFLLTQNMMGASSGYLFQDYELMFKVPGNTGSGEPRLPLSWTP